MTSLWAWLGITLTVVFLSLAALTVEEVWTLRRGRR